MKPEQELPPLPEPEYLDEYWIPPLRGYTADQMRAYAAQAVAADREALRETLLSMSEDEWTRVVMDAIRAIRAKGE